MFTITFLLLFDYLGVSQALALECRSDADHDNLIHSKNCNLRNFCVDATQFSVKLHFHEQYHNFLARKNVSVSNKLLDLTLEPAS